jgi:hypothetical protein
VLDYSSTDELNPYIVFAMGGADIATGRASRFGRRILFGDASHNASNTGHNFLVGILALVRTYT